MRSQVWCDEEVRVSNRVEWSGRSRRFFFGTWVALGAVAVACGGTVIDATQQAGSGSGGTSGSAAGTFSGVGAEAGTFAGGGAPNAGGFAGASVGGAMSGSAGSTGFTSGCSMSPACGSCGTCAEQCYCVKQDIAYCASACSGTTGGSPAGSGGGENAEPDANPPTTAVQDYVCQDQRPMVDPGGSTPAYEPCCGGIGFCSPIGASDTAEHAVFGHDVCRKSTASDDLLCIPSSSSDAGVGAWAGEFAQCTALEGNRKLEGRCLPQCVVAGSRRANELSPGDCPSSPVKLLCAPCYDPIDGKPTGACSQGGDAPVEPAPPPAKLCGAYDGGTAGGTCVPSAWLPAESNPDALAHQDECDPGDLCLPSLKAEDLQACLAPCQTTLASPYDDGACVPVFVIRDVNAVALAILDQSTCQSGDLCEPCADPLHAGLASGACD
jgi:hypothetical protein